MKFGCLLRNKILLLIVFAGALSVLILSRALYYTEGRLGSVSLHKFVNSDVAARLVRKKSTVRIPPMDLDCNNDGVLTIKSGGRVGNLMGEYATLWAIMQRDKLRAVLQPRTFNTLTKYFSNIVIPPLQSLPCLNLQWNHMNLRQYNLLSRPKRTKLARNGIYIDGYPTSVSLFHRYRTSIKEQFAFKSKLIVQANKKLSELRGMRKNVTFVGVHVRRTDYETFLKEHVGGVLVSRAYFSHAMDLFRSKYPSCLFIVISDDMDWCYKNFNNTRDDIVYAGNSNIQDPAEDLALLTMCNHSIITYGNFGFWGAYLAGGETILAGNVSTTPTDLMKSIEAANIPGWKFLPAQ